MNEIESGYQKKSKIEAISLRILLASIVIGAVMLLIIGSVFFKWAFELSRDWDFCMTSPFDGNIDCKSQYPGYKILFIYILSMGAFLTFYGVITALECITFGMIIEWKKKIPKYLFNWLMIKVSITCVIFISFGIIIHMIIS